MKRVTVSSRHLCLATLAASAAALGTVSAADYYWKGGDGIWDLGIYNGVLTPGTGGSTNPNQGAYYEPGGTWTSGTDNWRNSAGDTNYYWVNGENASITPTSGPTGPWMADSEIRGRAIFDTPGGGEITVIDNLAVRPDGLYVGLLDFREDGYRLVAGPSGSARIETHFGTGIVVSSGLSAEIGQGVNVELSGDALSGGGTINVTGSITRTSSGVISFRSGTTVNVNPGGTLGNSGSQTFIGQFGGAGILNVNGGTVLVGQNGQNRSLVLAAGSSNSGVVNLNSGSISISNSGTGRLILGDNQSSATDATFNLNGGTVTTPSVDGGGGTGVNSTFNFNGGTLRADRDSAVFMQSLDHAYVLAGGAVFDTNNRNITVGQALEHDPFLGSTPDGGLVKDGTGTLTLTGLNSFTGDTVINEGTLSLTSMSLADLANVHINGATSLFNLNFVGTDTIGALFFDGSAAATGTWGALGSTADNPSALFTGPGLLNVTAVPEPSSAAFVLSMAGCLMLVRRRNA